MNKTNMNASLYSARDHKIKKPSEMANGMFHTNLPEDQLRNSLRAKMHLNSNKMTADEFFTTSYGKSFNPSNA